MPRPPASRRWDAPSHCGGSRAAAADADIAVVPVAEGPDLIARLRAILGEAPAAKRFVFLLSPSLPPLLGKGTDARLEVIVLAKAITDTCKEVVDGWVRRTIPRDTLANALGPWVFPRQTLTEALDRIGPQERITAFVDLCRIARLDVLVAIEP